MKQFTKENPELVLTLHFEEMKKVWRYNWQIIYDSDIPDQRRKKLGPVTSFCRLMKDTGIAINRNYRLVGCQYRQKHRQACLSSLPININFCRCQLLTQVNVVFCQC